MSIAFTTVEAFIKPEDPRGKEAFDMLKERFKDNPLFSAFAESQEKRFHASLKGEVERG